MSLSIPRYAFIDSLRALAILGVIAVHTAQWVQPDSEFLRQVVAEGARGVQLFFVASALTIFMSFRRRSVAEAAPIKNYFIRRFFRIAPLFYLGIVLWLFIDGYAPRYWAPNGIDGWTVFLTTFFMHGFHPETITSLVPGGWSIAVEMMFYLLVPLLISYVRDFSTAIAFFLVSLLVNWVLTGAAVSYWLDYYPPELGYLARSYGLLWFFAQLPVFALGVIAFHIISNNQFGARPKMFGRVMLVTAVVLWVAFLDVRSFQGLIPQHVFYGASFLCLALALAAHPTRLLVNPVMRTLGEISFSLYVFHFVVLYVLEKMFFLKGFPFHGNAGFVTAWLWVVVVSSLISFISYRYVERPGMAVGKFLIDLLESNSTRKVYEN